MATPQLIVHGLSTLEALELEEELTKNDVDATLTTGKEAEEEGKQYALVTTSLLVFGATRIAIQLLTRWLRKRKNKKKLPGLMIKVQGGAKITVNETGSVKVESTDGKQVIEVGRLLPSEQLEGEDLSWLSELLQQIKEVIKDATEK